MAQERLQKVLARAGIASRRAAEVLITARRVRVDGRIVSELGTRVDVRARIEVDGRIVVAEPLVYLVLHKPRGVVCTLKDPEGRPTVAEYLKDVGARVVPVGRLDFHTSGALICTNDGELASKLMHPSHHAEKEYVAKVNGVVDERTLEKLQERIVIDGRETRPADVRLLRVEDGKSWLAVKLGEGRNRQVRRLGEHAGVPVMRLVRVGHAGITAEGLRPGEWRRLTLDELKDLKKEFGVPRRIHAVDPRTDQPRGGHVAVRQPRHDAHRVRAQEQPRQDAHRARAPERPRAAGRSRDERTYGDERPRAERRSRGDAPAPAPGHGRASEFSGERRPRSDARGYEDARPERTSSGPRGARGYEDARPGRTSGPRGAARPRSPARPEAHAFARGHTHARDGARPRAEHRDGAGPRRDGAPKPREVVPKPRRDGRSRR